MPLKQGEAEHCREQRYVDGGQNQKDVQSERRDRHEHSPQSGAFLEMRFRDDPTRLYGDRDGGGYCALNCRLCDGVFLPLSE